MKLNCGGFRGCCLRPSYGFRVWQCLKGSWLTSKGKGMVFCYKWSAPSVLSTRALFLVALQLRACKEHAFCIVTKRPWQLPLDPTHAVYYVWTLLMDFCFALLDSTKINIVSHHYPIGSHWESFFRFFFLFWELHGMCMAVIQFSPCLSFSNLLPCLL